jgi:hypothetical protein
MEVGDEVVSELPKEKCQVRHDSCEHSCFYVRMMDVVIGLVDRGFEDDDFDIIEKSI